jgi:hypothetical protein
MLLTNLLSPLLIHLVTWLADAEKRALALGGLVGPVTTLHPGLQEQYWMLSGHSP